MRPRSADTSEPAWVKRKMLSMKKSTSFPSSSRKYSAMVTPVSPTRRRAPGGSFIFRFPQAGSEVSALLGRMPSAVGYQPTLSTEMGALQERITTTRKGSITSVQAIYVPADDLTDPAPAASFAHLDATTVLSR